MTKIDYFYKIITKTLDCDLFMIHSRRSSTFVLWSRFKLIYNQVSMCVACYTLNEAMRSFIFCCGIPYTLKLLELSRLFECIFFLTNVISCKSQTILTQLKLIFFISFFLRIRICEFLPRPKVSIKKQLFYVLIEMKLKVLQ